MSFKIETISFHKQQITVERDRNLKRLDMNVEDCALSSWSSSCLGEFHRKAIEALRLGRRNGSTLPWGEFWQLMDAEGNHVGRAVPGKFGMCWLLNDEEAAKFGRRFIPFNCDRPGKIQKQLGLHQELIAMPAKRWMKGRCACVGSPMSFSLQRADS